MQLQLDPKRIMYIILAIIITIGVIIMTSCTTYNESTPQCDELEIEHRDSIWIVWKDIDTVMVHHNDELIRNWCKRDEDLKISSNGRWSAILKTNGWVCMDFDSEVTHNDYECCSPLIE